MPNFEYSAPATLQDAIDLLRDPASVARPLAGGTDLVPQMKEGATRFPAPSRLVSLHRIAALKGIAFSESAGLRLGAGVTMAEIAASAVIREHFPAIAEGASVVGSLQTMNMATVGGNLCNAAPSADTAPALLALDARAVIAGRSGRREVPVEELFRGPGLTALESGELLVELLVPAPPAGGGSAYRRHTPRKRMDIAVVGVAAALTLEGGHIARARVALGAVGPTPMRSRAAEAALDGQPATGETFAVAAEAAASDARPISDIRGSAAFRRHLAGVMTRRVLEEAARRAAGSS